MFTPKDIRPHLAKVQTAIAELQDHLDDVTISDEDLQAIKEAEADVKAGRTRRL